MGEGKRKDPHTRTVERGESPDRDGVSTEEGEEGGVRTPCVGPRFRDGGGGDVSELPVATFGPPGPRVPEEESTTDPRSEGERNGVVEADGSVWRLEETRSHRGDTLPWGMKTEDLGNEGTRSLISYIFRGALCKTPHSP